MEKTIEIDGKQVTFKTSGAVPMRYKMQFGRDFFKDLFGMGIEITKVNFDKMNDLEKVQLIRQIDFDLFFNIAWTFAKTADSSVKDPMTWLDSFNTFPIIEILPQLQDMLTATISTTKKK